MITTKHTTSNVLIIVLALLCLFVPSVIFAAATYEPLVGIPGLDKTATLPEYINAIYAIVVGLGAVYGVFKIAYIGFKYSLSDSIIGKVDAKSEIGGVLLGLLILLIPYIVLNTINPDLVDMNILRNLGDVSAIGNAPSIATPPPTANLGGDIVAPGGGVDLTPDLDLGTPCLEPYPTCLAQCRASGGVLNVTSGGVTPQFSCKNSLSVPVPTTPTARDESRYPRSGTITRQLTLNLSNEARDALTPLQMTLLENNCTEQGGSLNIFYGCTKNETLTCTDTTYFDDVLKECTAIPR